MADPRSRAWAQIDLSALRHNLQQVRHIVGPNVRVWPAVKANAYGHGAAEVVSELVSAGADGFCVATPQEAVAIHHLAGSRTILLMGSSLPGDVPVVLESGAETVVTDRRFAEALSEAARNANRVVRVHLKIDTGMGRIGVPVSQAVAMAQLLEILPGLELTGVMTHFPSSDEADLSYTHSQTEIFTRVADEIISVVNRPLIRHAANSGAVLAVPEAYLDAVRPGIIIYGCYPSPDVARPIELKPVMSLRARIVFLKEVKHGTTVSYGRTWAASRKRRIATVGIGYGDGLPRSLSNNGSAIVRGQIVPIVGRVCMDQTMLDVTDINDVETGDEAVFWGSQGECSIRCDEVALRLGTIPYELTCQITPRVVRVYQAGSDD